MDIHNKISKQNHIRNKSEINLKNINNNKEDAL